MSKNLIWLAIGGVVAYLLLTSKKSSATKVEEPPKDSNITTKVEEPKKGIDSTPKEPRSKADCLRDEKFSPSQSEKEITLTKKDGTIEIVKQEAQPARCIKIKMGPYALPLPNDRPKGINPKGGVIAIK